MAKRKTRRITKRPRKGSKASFKAIRKQAKARATAEKASTRRASADVPTGTLMGREARTKERFRELVAWYMLRGMDEGTAPRHAQDEMDDDSRKD